MYAITQFRLALLADILAFISFSDPSSYQQVRGLSITSAIDDSTQSADGGTCLPRQLDLRVDWVQFYHGV